MPARVRPSGSSATPPPDIGSRRSADAFMQQLVALVTQEGISGLTVGEIAARLQCSRRRLYDLASTKEELLRVVAREVFDDVLRQGAVAATGQTDAAAAVVTYLHVGVTAAARLSPAFRADLEATAEGRAVFDDYQEARRKGLQTLIDAGAASGRLVPHNAAVIAEAALGAAHRLRQPRVLQHAGVSMETAFSEFYAVLTMGLLPRPEA